MTRLALLAAVLGLFVASGCSTDNPSALKVTLRIDPNPDRIDAPWEIDGPGNYHLSGRGDRTLADLEGGDYQLTWGQVDGWETPARNPYTQRVPEGSSFTFSATYTPLLVDVVMINPNPDHLHAPWELAGPSGPLGAGAGDSTLTDMEAGTYTVTWGEVLGWDFPSPNPSVLTLQAGGFVEFVGDYQELPPRDTVVLDPNPDDLNAGWSLVGPAGFNATGNGDSTFVAMVPGDYSVTWGDIASYNTPDPETLELIAGGNIVFRGNYNRFVLLTPGQNGMPASFQMGSPANESGRYDREDPQHTVTLTRPFYISTTEVTQAEWDAVLGDSIPNPSFFGGCAECPVERVSWYNAVVYCNERSRLEGYAPAYLFDPELGVVWDRDADGYRLPSEAEWEYACRAGSTTPFANGDYVQTVESCDPFGVDIPDNDPQGVQTSVAPPVNKTVLDISVYVNIVHPNIGDLVITLESPTGTMVTLHDRGGEGTADLSGWYPGDLTPAQSLAVLLGEDILGDWTLHLTDASGTSGSGSLLSWCVKIDFQGVSQDDWNECLGDRTLERIGWFCANADSMTHLVGQLEPNAWGVFDMHGNVWEWCWDWYGPYGGDQIDPTGPSEGDNRILRGGSWDQRARGCRSAMRGIGQVGKLDPGPGTGFRLARNAD